MISYADVTAGALKVAKCAGIWTPTFRAGLPVISYADVTAGALMVAKCANPACTGSATITTVDPTGGGRTSIALGSNGLPVVNYGSVEVATCGNPACTTSSINPLAAGSNSSLTIDSNGFPVVAYIDLGVMRVAWCNPFATCSTAQFNAVDDPEAGSQGFPTIAFGADGLPLISYYDGPGRSLRVVKCGTRTCQ